MTGGQKDQLNPKIAFVWRFWTQIATWRPNQKILTSSVQAILKAMIATVFLGTKFKGGQNFLLTVGVFFNKREYSGADWLVPLLKDYLLNQLITKVSSAGQCSHLLRFFLHAPNLFVWLKKAPKQILCSFPTQYFI